jgi:hypothetical protein
MAPHDADHDFREAAAGQSERVLKEARLVNVLDSRSSLCLRADPHTLGPLYRIALVPWIWLAVAASVFLFGVILAVLILTPWVDANLRSIGLASAGVVVGAVLIVMSASAGDGVFEGVMESRLGSRLVDVAKRVVERYPFCVEDSATFQKLKVISEDYATGGVDKRNPGLLLEGLRYRYVVRPQDVNEVRQADGHLLVTYTVGSARITLALNVPLSDDEKEQQALDSITRALSPDVTS